MTTFDLSKKVLDKFPTAMCIPSEHKIGVSVELGSRRFRVIKETRTKRFIVSEEHGCSLKETEVSKFVQELLNR